MVREWFASNAKAFVKWWHQTSSAKVAELIGVGIVGEPLQLAVIEVQQRQQLTVASRVRPIVTVAGIYIITRLEFGLLADKPVIQPIIDDIAIEAEYSIAVHSRSDSKLSRAALTNVAALTDVDDLVQYGLISADLVDPISSLEYST